MAQVCICRGFQPDPAALRAKHAFQGDGLLWPAQESELGDADRFFAGIEACQQLRRQGVRPRLIFTRGWWPTQPHLPPGSSVLQVASAFHMPRAKRLFERQGLESSSRALREVIGRTLARAW